MPHIGDYPRPRWFWNWDVTVACFCRTITPHDGTPMTWTRDMEFWYYLLDLMHPLNYHFLKKKKLVMDDAQLNILYGIQHYARRSVFIAVAGTGIMARICATVLKAFLYTPNNNFSWPSMPFVTDMSASPSRFSTVGFWNKEKLFMATKVVKTSKTS